MDVIFSLDIIENAAATFLQAIGHRKVVAFHGEMGAGKTTFIHAVCNLLNVNETVSSPTFSIINAYTTAGDESIFHMDLYRIKNEAEAIDTGVEDALYTGSLCLVEWPEKAPSLFPDDTVHCYLETTGNNERKLEIKL
jgi:tRNA threonylcarbamoyladenosine biosynthesis protein TsaE